MRKKSSTNYANEERLLRSCGVAYAVARVGGRWKPGLLWELLDGKKRYAELRKRLAGVTERVLVRQLKELERDGLVARHVVSRAPLRVEYELTALGRSMAPMLESMSDWGRQHVEPKPR